MAIQVTQWQPDTCGCTIQYKWDDSVPLEERVHSVHNIVEKCEAHSDTPTHEHHFDKVLEENRRKNKVHSYLVEKHSKLTRPDPNGSPLLKDDVYFWEFDKDRKLIVKVKGLTAKEKTDLNAATPDTVEVQ